MLQATFKCGDRQSLTRKRGAGSPYSANSSARGNAEVVAISSLRQWSGTTALSEVETPAHGSPARAATIGAA